jgi:hypothetical protein
VLLLLLWKPYQIMERLVQTRRDQHALQISALSRNTPGGVHQQQPPGLQLLIRSDI